MKMNKKLIAGVMLAVMQLYSPAAAARKKKKQLRQQAAKSL